MGDEGAVCDKSRALFSHVVQFDESVNFATAEAEDFRRCAKGCDCLTTE